VYLSRPPRYLAELSDKASKNGAKVLPVWVRASAIEVRKGLVMVIEALAGAILINSISINHL
jgi:hypothetical protein